MNLNSQTFHRLNKIFNQIPKVILDNKWIKQNLSEDATFDR